MSRIQTLEKDKAPQNVVALYEAVEKKLGLVPNMVKTLGHSAAALQGYLGLSGAVSAGRIRPSTREKIALLVAELNDCSYCLSAHTAIGGAMRIPIAELGAARNGNSPDPKEKAILDLVKAILESHGAISEVAFEAAAAAGVTDEEAAEIVANVAVNIYTNYFNRFADTDIDFPKVEAFTTREAA